jgi:hypothetical protein
VVIAEGIHLKRETHVLVAGNSLLETLALAHLLDDLTGLGGGVEGRTAGKDSPVVEDGLGEGLTTGGGAQIGGETEGLVDGEVSLDVEQRSTRALLLGVDVTTTAGKDTVDTTHGLLGDLDLDVEDGLEETGVGKHGSGVQDTTSSGDELTATTVDSISVQGNIEDVEADGAEGLLSDGTLTGGPLETGDNGILDFVQVLNGLGLVNQQVGTGGVGTEAPNLTSIGDIPAVVVSKDTGTGLEIVTGADLAGLDGESDLLLNGLSSHVQTVVLVGGLGQSGHAGLSGDGLTVGDDGVGNAEGNTGVVLLKILQANLEVELTSTGNDVLTGLVDHGQNARVGLGQTLETLDKLGQILGVLDLDGALHNGGDGELHDLEVVGGLIGGQGTGLEQELIDTDQTDNVTGGDVLNGLDEATHHEDSTLDGLDVQVLLLARGVVGALDADLDTRLDGTSVDTTEGVETTLVGGGNHLGDVQHEGSSGVTVTDTNAGLVVSGTLVQSLGTVLLGSNGGRQVDTDHLKESVGSGQELAHDDLEEGLALEVLLLRSELDLELLKENGKLLLLVVVDSGEDLEDGVQDELVEGTLKGLAISITSLGPLLGLGVEVVVAPQTLKHLLAVNTELLGVLDGELADSEAPAVETGTESDGTAVGVDLDITKSLVEVGGDDDVDGLNGTGEGLVQILLGNLELKQGTVDLVDAKNGLDTLGQGLTQDSLGLDTDTGDTVDDDQGTVSDTESGSDLGREINVTGGIDQVDQELRTVDLLGNLLKILGVGELGVQGDGSGLDGNATILLIGTGVHETGLTGLGGGDNTGTLDKGVGEGGLSVIDWREEAGQSLSHSPKKPLSIQIQRAGIHTVSNDGHVTDVGRSVHQRPDLDVVLVYQVQTGVVQGAGDERRG